jgi:hypothetical protein
VDPQKSDDLDAIDRRADNDPAAIEIFDKTPRTVASNGERRNSNLGARAIPPTNERGLLHRRHDRDDPSLWDAESVFLDGPDHAEKS